MVDVDDVDLEARLERGWRRFGPDYFRPRCPSCVLCMPSRVPTASFRPNKSQRRAMKACSELVVQESTPTFDQERLDLYARWHAEREGKRGWEGAELTERGYRLQFAFPHPAARELAFIDPQANKLVGIALCDETPNAYSAIYFFYDPAYKHLSMGTANVLFQIRLAKARGLAHVYLGYYVENCPSLAYKAKFQPQERLESFVDLEEEPRWLPLDASEAALTDS